MKSEVKKLDSSKVEINIELTSETVKNKFDEVFQKIGKEAKVPGFRPGNAPRDLIEKNFSQIAHEQVLKELIPEAYDEAVKKGTLDVIDMPDISEVKLDRNSLSFKATVEVSPEIKLKEYKGVKINYKRVEVTGDDVKRHIDALKESRKAEAADDNLAKAIGYPSLAELEKVLQMQAFIQKENQQRTKIENELIETITKDIEFKVPGSLVERQLQELLRHTKVDMAMKGMPREKIEEQEKEMEKNLRPEAEKQVRIYLVLSAIAKKENIPVDDHMPRKVLELLFKEANWQVS